jgi:hypothetical protein
MLQLSLPLMVADGRSLLAVGHAQRTSPRDTIGTDARGEGGYERG